jgi:anti-sigma B factor antagonist
MQLILQSQMAGDVVVINCQGCIVSGDEVRALQSEVEKLTRFTKRVVLQLAEASYIDSGGLGALVRLFGALRADGGDLKLCQLSPFVLQVLRATNLFGVFHTYASEREAIEAFSGGLRPIEKTSQASRTRIVCIDSSRDLLAYLNALLKQAGYEVFTTRYPSEAMILVGASRPGVVIYGSGMPSSDAAIEKFRHSVPNVQVLLLPSDFSTVEASQAGTELVDRVRSVLTAQP